MPRKKLVSSSESTSVQLNKHHIIHYLLFPF